MAHHLMLDDEPEIHPNPQNIATAIIRIGRTAHNFLTCGNPGLPAPSVPEHWANLEYRRSDNTSLTYRPYRPYTSFTPSPSHEGQHSSHSMRRVSQTPQLSLLNIASPESSSTFADSQFNMTEYLFSPLTTSSSTPSGSPSIPIPMSPSIPTTHTDLATVTPTTPITVSPVSTIPVYLTTSDTQHGDVPMGDEHSSQVNDDDDVMEQDIATVVPPLITPVLQPIQHPPSTSSTRTRPLPLPNTAETYSGQLLNKQFAELSDKIVGPALSKAIDGMIPAMVERIAGEIRGLSSPCSHHPRVLKRGSVEDYDTEPEHEDDLTPSPHRKHPGKCGTKNHLHDLFRKYLRDKHFLKLKSKNGPLPQSPPSHVVEAYNRDNDNPPTLDKIAIDWQDSLRSSVWNAEAVDLLVVDFQEKVKTGSFPLVIFDNDTMNLDNLCVLCINKLRRTQQACREHMKIEGFEDSQQREVATRDLSYRNSRRQHLDRCNTCKHGTLERHRKVVDQNRHRNPQSWDTIRRIIDWLDVDGMSGDETDTPLGVTPKIVRHVALPWISPAITDLLHAIESYVPTVYEENMSVPVGNSSLLRLMEAKRTSKNSIAIARLPAIDFDVPLLGAYYSANDIRR
ncbi:uncharacterized protein F5147DRAFT_780815 [Suillus discolor]|uniref:Uncharacterized protein n=1 Tax=Suillus discolor TaxID=1912936 RepID=A0A9P7JM86_9AGAM|nr:uncharacterized protein F5147DRAFT_780815 [Suillus discolor]KAG2088937.1 hypothetical protein F5147DRAFT_780815 [Suillus discolor]